MNPPNEKFVIICVDDEKIVLDSLSHQLQRYFKDRYEFEFAESGEEALEIIKEQVQGDSRVAMVISDQIMPGMSGEQLLTQIHQEDPQTITILLTGQASLDSAIKAINNAKLFRYLSKPWVENDFLLTVEKGLEQFFLHKVSNDQIKLFEQFFPKDFLQCLSKESMLDIHLGDHVQRDMSILFTDIRNFTTISEKMTPEENYQFVNEYIKYIEPAIHNNHGFIDKYIGDAILALFYTPLDAFQASLDIQKRIIEFNKAHAEEKYYPISCGVGLHCGTLMLGIVGVEKRLQVTVISDAVNLCARLQDLAPTAGALIMASKSFIDKLKDQPVDNIRFLGHVNVKGKAEVIPIFEVISLDNDPLSSLKIATKSLLHEGLNLFYDKKFAESCVKFKAILEQNPADKAVQRYLNLAAKYMLEGTPEDWEGIYMSDLHQKPIPMK